MGSKLSPMKLNRMREMRADGKSLRETGRALKLSPSTVLLWERRDVSKNSRQPNAASDAGARGRAALSAETLLSSPLPDRSDPNALAKVRSLESLIHAAIVKLAPAVETEEYSATSFVRLCRYADDLTRLHVQLTAVHAPEASETGDRLAEEKELVARFEQLVGEAEQRVKAQPACPDCGEVRS